jgi:hypothetical protein
VRVLATTVGCPPFLLIRAKEASPNSFNNIIEASKATSINRHAIGKNCSGKTKFGGGFIWKKE